MGGAALALGLLGWGAPRALWGFPEAASALAGGWPLEARGAGWGPRLLPSRGEGDGVTVFWSSGMMIFQRTTPRPLRETFSGCEAGRALRKGYLYFKKTEKEFITGSFVKKVLEGRSGPGARRSLCQGQSGWEDCCGHDSYPRVCSMDRSKRQAYFSSSKKDAMFHSERSVLLKKRRRGSPETTNLVLII